MDPSGLPRHEKSENNNSKTDNEAKSDYPKILDSSAAQKELVAVYNDYCNIAPRLNKRNFVFGCLVVLTLAVGIVLWIILNWIYGISVIVGLMILMFVLSDWFSGSDQKCIENKVSEIEKKYQLSHEQAFDLLDSFYEHSSGYSDEFESFVKTIWGQDIVRRKAANPELGNLFLLKKYGCALDDPDELWYRIKKIDNANVRAAIVSNIPCLGRVIVPALVLFLNDPDWLVVIKAANALFRMGKDAEQATNELIKFLQSFLDKYPSARSAWEDSDKNIAAPMFALKALGEIANEQAHKALKIVAASSPNQVLRNEALRILRRSGIQVDYLDS